MSDHPPTTDEREVRRAKVEALIAQGQDPFSGQSPRTHTVAEVLAHFLPLTDEELEASSTEISIVGRIMAKRLQGQASFAHLQDSSDQLQLYVRKDQVGEEPYETFKHLDRGDFLGVTGRLFRTKRGELSLRVRSFQLLSKSLRPLPEKYHGLRDIEQLYRKRYLGLIMEPKVREAFVKRSLMVRALRKFLEGQGYLEVETPTLHAIAGGAAARPFVTHHNALDREFYLRIALELPLKKLIVGGLERVYEIGRVYRNEGVSTRHNPEFTLLELYAAYTNYEDMMDITEQLFAHCAQEISGSTSILYQGVPIDLKPGWPRKTMAELVKEHTGVDFNEPITQEKAVALAKEHGIQVRPTASPGHVLEAFFEAKVEDKLIQPTFVHRYPVEISPLAKHCPDDHRFVERFELWIGGREYANAHTELNDPIDQRARFVQQMAVREQGDDEAHQMDEDFLEAMEYGMPPHGGLGIGIERMAMLLTDSASIRDILLFPHMRAEA